MLYSKTIRIELYLYLFTKNVSSFNFICSKIISMKENIKGTTTKPPFSWILDE